MTVSDILATTVSSLRTRAVGLVGITLAFFVLQVVFSILLMVFVGGAGLLASAAGDADSLGMGAMGMVFLSYLLSILIYCAQANAMSHYASPLTDANMGDAFAIGFRSALTLAVASVLLIVIYLVAGGIIGGVAAATGETGGVIVLLLLVPVMVYLACRLSIISPVIAVDGVRNPITAVARTWNLTGGNVLPIFLAILALVLLAILVFGIMFAVFFGAMPSTAQSFETGEAPIGMFAGAIFGYLLVFMGVGLVFAAILTALMATIHSKVSDRGTEQLTETFG